jgi:hypothetical protein
MSGNTQESDQDQSKNDFHLFLKGKTKNGGEKKKKRNRKIEKISKEWSESEQK